MREEIVDNGLEREIVEKAREAGESVKPYADSHRKFIKEKKKLGFRSHTKPPCSSCGHRICRCADKRRREDIGKNSCISKWND